MKDNSVVKSLCRVSNKDVSGEIPQELANLTYLQKLYLDRNYLTGPLPPFIGYLSALKYMSLSANSLSGTIPRELGNLSDLVALSLGINSFSGPLPPEMGNLSNLQELHIDSSGFSGKIPSTFSQLRNMEKLYASDNSFTGKVPDFMGSWTKLTTLYLHGNNFEGPIPRSFSNLSSLTELRLGDITNGSSPLAVIQNMKFLKILVLRNCKISEMILPNFDEYKNLTFLDLSFNNLRGQLPQSLFNSNSLEYLFLGNNSLSGSLPIAKSSKLLNVDVSYNELSGSFPSWVRDKDLKLNLVANNFTDTANASVMPLGLCHLQRDSRCNHHTSNHSSFAVQCGGKSKTVKGIKYDADDKDLSVAAYYVTDIWGVSNTGYFSGQSNSIDSSGARGSRSSLRYYGLGLQNGYYNITLEFPDLAYKEKPTWKYLERRIFDIYIQGDLVAKDFNIRKESDAFSNGPIIMTYSAHVIDNFLEIHLFWSGKGTCCIPEKGSYGPLISSISVAAWETSQKKSHTRLYAGILAGGFALALLSIAGILLWITKRKRLNTDDDDNVEVSSFTVRVDTFGYADLKTATDGFNSSNKLGEGGFGPVFKPPFAVVASYWTPIQGVLADGRPVAVKQLSRTTEQGKVQFLTEITTISSVQHRNLVKLYGYCIERNWRFLVYEYLEYKSLDQALFGKSNIQLDWNSRFNICLGTARGLAYLHGESTVRIIHRDVKSSNILLDVDMTPKISDFGLAKLYDDKKTHLSTRVAGTIGYLAPEYAMTGHLTEKVDVFGFGVVILEVLSGKPSSSSNLGARKVFLLEWAWQLHESNRELEIVDSNLSFFNEEEAILLFQVALLCTQMSPMLRPPMSRVVAMLAGDVPVPNVVSKPGYVTDWRTDSLSDCTTSTDFYSSATTATSSTVTSTTAASSDVRNTQ